MQLLYVRLLCVKQLLLLLLLLLHFLFFFELGDCCVDELGKDSHRYVKLQDGVENERSNVRVAVEFQLE